MNECDFDPMCPHFNDLVRRNKELLKCLKYVFEKTKDNNFSAADRLTHIKAATRRKLNPTVKESGE